MRLLTFLILGVLALALQTTVFPVMPEWIGVPDLLFLLILSLAIYGHTWSGALLTLVFGVGMEVFSGYYLGLYLLAYLLVFFAIKGLAARFDLNALNHQPPMAILAYLFVNAFVYLATMMLSDDLVVPWVWGTILQRALILIILVIPMSRLFQTAMRWSETRRKGRSLFRKKKGNYYTAGA